MLFQAAVAEGHETSPVDAPGVLGLQKGALFRGGPIFRLRVVIDLLRQNWRLFRCIRQNGGDAIWIRGSKGIAFGALGSLLSGRPLIWDVDYELPSRGVVRWLHRFGLWASQVVVFQYAAAPGGIFGWKLARRYRDKCRTFIPGIDLPAVQPFQAARERRHNAEGDPFVILQVGTICDRKNQRVLVEAMTKVIQAERDKAIEVWFAGDVFEQKYAEALHEEVRTHGFSDVVLFLGWRFDVHELMAAADLLVMPSRDEGVPNTVQEAMAIGLPVAVSRAGGMPEVVENGVTGWIVDADDASAWGGHIIRCLKSRTYCEAVGQEGRRYALEHFGMERWGAEYSRVIKEAVCRQRVNPGAGE